MEKEVFRDRDGNKNGDKNEEKNDWTYKWVHYVGELILNSHRFVSSDCNA